MSWNVKPFTKKQLENQKKDLGVRDKVYPREVEYRDKKWKPVPLRGA